MGGLDDRPKRWCSKCGEHLDKELFARCKKHGRQRHCRECHRKLMLSYRRQGYAAIEAGRYGDPVTREKVKARSRMNMRVKRGLLARQPCERCGAGNAQKHHDDYAAPTVVRWLCQKCHGTEHYPEATRAGESALERICRKHSERTEG